MRIYGLVSSTLYYCSSTASLLAVAELLLHHLSTYRTYVAYKAERQAERQAENTINSKMGSNAHVLAQLPVALASLWGCSMLLHISTNMAAVRQALCDPSVGTMGTLPLTFVQSQAAER